MLDEAIPGNIRKAEHFIAFLKRFIEYLKVRLIDEGSQLISDSNEGITCRCRNASVVLGPSEGNYIYREKAAQVSLELVEFDKRANARFAAERLTSLVRTLELTNIDEHYALQKVASFGTLIATYEKGFLLILEPYETEHATVPNPIFHTVYVFTYTTHKVMADMQLSGPLISDRARIRAFLLSRHYIRNNLAFGHVRQDLAIPTCPSPFLSNDPPTERFLPYGHHPWFGSSPNIESI